MTLKQRLTEALMRFRRDHPILSIASVIVALIFAALIF